MTLAESEHVAAPSPASRGRAITCWAEQLLPRLVGLVFLWSGFEKAVDPARIQRVLAFDGIPSLLVPATALLVWTGEITIGVCLLFSVARLRTISIAIFVLLVFSVQLAYLIVSQNP